MRITTNNNYRQFVHIGVLGLALLIGVGAFVSRAQTNKEKENPVSLSNVAMVDMQRVYNSSSAPQELDIKTQQFEQEALDKLKSIATAPYLDQAELTVYSDLVGKSQLTEAQKKQIAELRAANERRVIEVRRIESLGGKLSPEEQKLYNEMQQRKRSVDQMLPFMRADLQNQEARFIELARQDQIRQQRAIVEKVAKEKGFTNVFDSQALVYSTNDITNIVIQKINKK